MKPAWWPWSQKTKPAAFSSPSFEEKSLPPIPQNGQQGRKEWLYGALVVWFLFFLVLTKGWICPLYALAKIPCPGCGMTRAWRAMIGGQWMESLVWHPLLIPTILLLGSAVGLGLAGDQKKGARLLKFWALLMLAGWLIRLIFGLLPS